MQGAICAYSLILQITVGHFLAYRYISAKKPYKLQITVGYFFA